MTDVTENVTKISFSSLLSCRMSQSMLQRFLFQLCRHDRRHRERHKHFFFILVVMTDVTEHVTKISFSSSLSCRTSRSRSRTKSQRSLSSHSTYRELHCTSGGLYCTAKGSHHGRKAAYLRSLSSRRGGEGVGGSDQFHIFWGDFVIYMEVL